MGSSGAYAAGANRLQKMVPGFKVKAVDSTAAGEVFNGELAVALMQGKSLEDAVHYGAAVGALSITCVGAQPAMPSARAVRNFLKSMTIPEHRE